MQQLFFEVGNVDLKMVVLSQCWLVLLDGFVNTKSNTWKSAAFLYFMFICRGSRIRTCDPLLPKQVR